MPWLPTHGFTRRCSQRDAVYDSVVNSPILPGAEPFSAAGGPSGVLVVHGFTGNPQSMRPLAEAFADAGFTVELPLLPGHGTSVDDMLATTWADWSSAAEAAYGDLSARCDSVVVAGLSMGGTLATWLAANHPEIRGLVAINALAESDPAMRDGIAELAGQGLDRIPGIGSDIAKPGVTELAYPEVPLAALLSLFDAVDQLSSRLADVTCPVLVMSSPADHVVPPASSDRLATQVSGPVERVTLARSYHVATLDHDAALIESEAVAFAQKVTAG